MSYELKGMPNCPWCNADNGYVHKRKAFKDKRRKGIIVKRTLETGFKCTKCGKNFLNPNYERQGSLE